MRIRDWQDILEEVADSKADPGDWQAIAGTRDRGIGEDLFLGHPGGGVFQLKTFAKNPFEVRGVGTRVARRIDDDLAPLFPDEDRDGRFGVNDGVEDEDEAADRAKDLKAVVKAHKEAPTSSEDFFHDVMEALDSPAYGPMEFDMYDRPEELDELTGTFEEAEDLLTSELDELIDDSDVDRGFH